MVAVEIFASSIFSLAKLAKTSGGIMSLSRWRLITCCNVVSSRVYRNFMTTNVDGGSKICAVYLEVWGHNDCLDVAENVGLEEGGSQRIKSKEWRADSP